MIFTATLCRALMTARVDTEAITDILTTDTKDTGTSIPRNTDIITDIKTNEKTEALYGTDEELAQLKQSIFDGLYSAFSEILDNPEKLREKSEASIEKIKNDHSPEKYGQRLAEIYNL